MNKTLSLAVLSLTLGAAVAFAADYAESPFAPVSPDTMGRGGSLVADSSGYNSFFNNPAGFSRGAGSFTLGDATAWVYSRPDQLLPLGLKLMDGTTTQADTASFMNDQVTAGGLGVGASAGIGYAGNGLGLGAVMVVDSLLHGSTLLGAEGNLTGTVGFIGGLSFPLDLFGFKVHLGGDVRPMIRIHVPVTNSVAIGVLSSLINSPTNSTAVMAALNAANALYGVGIGLDVGAIADLGWLTAGLSVRDLAGTQFRYSSTTFGILQNSLTTAMEFPTSALPVNGDNYAIPMDIAIGVAVHPDLGTFSNVIDPSINLDLHDVIGALAGTKSVWTLLHAGAEVRLLSFVTVRAGLDQGYLTAGVGLKLAFLDLNVAMFTQELGQRVGDMPSSGATLSLAIR